MERPSASTAPSMIIGVIGASCASQGGYEAAREVGRLIALRRAVLVCGGLGGVMEGAARGCAEEGGTVLGLLPGGEAADANPFVTLAVPTNLGHARNVVIAQTARALIAVEGEYGTLSEMAIGLKLGRPVIALRSPFEIPGLQHASTPKEAVALAFAALEMNP